MDTHIKEHLYNYQQMARCRTHCDSVMKEVIQASKAGQIKLLVGVLEKRRLYLKPKFKCRCYINAKYYARQAKKGGNLKGYIPCPIHEKRVFD
ncbi:hypothetical protein ES707_05417 [subsurface metagenome]